MRVKNVEFNFEVAYSYNTVMKNVMQEVAKQCHDNLYKEIVADIRCLETKFEYCKVLDSIIELNEFDARVVLDVDIDERIGATDEERLALFKDWSYDVFRAYISLSSVAVAVEGVVERTVRATLVPVK